MKRNYRILSFLLSIALCMSSISVPSYAAEGMMGVVYQNEMESLTDTESEAGADDEGIVELETDISDESSVETETDISDDTITETGTDANDESSAETETDTMDESFAENGNNTIIENDNEVPTENTNIAEVFTINSMAEAGNESEANSNNNTNKNAIMPSYSETVINPVYEGILDKDEVREELSEEAKKSGEYFVASTDTALTTVNEVVDYVREQMVARNTNISTVIPYTLYESVSSFPSTVFNTAIAHTEECSGQEGDALAWGWTGYNFSGGGTYDEFIITWTVTYHTTAEQETALTQKVNSIMDELAFSASTSQHDKIKAIHDYICDTADYDYSYTKYSAYEALCNGSAVCQGYAIACYRLCKEAGIPVRLISGIGNGGAHGWNIVKIGNVYYNIDCTWDGQTAVTYDKWFLLSELDFVNHTRDEEYATEEFYQTYPMSQYSWGQETFEGYNQDNFSYTFTTVDDGTISSTADGKPKLLIFFRPDCSNSQRTISSLAGYDLAGVDIYAMDAYRNDKETVQAFKETYGSDNIVFSYSTEYANTTPAWKYVRVRDPEAQSYTFPVIAYIDANDKIQYVTTGISDGKQISNYLQLACGYTEQFREYTISYNLDGGSNHADNPKSFTAHTDTIILKPATKTGFAFKGWYADAEYQTQVREIAKGSKKNVTLYAKFVKELELTLPSKTTYAIGEKLDLAGGRIVHGETGKSADLTDKMVSGFSSEEEGICTVTVTYQNCTTTFDVLVVSEPEMDADFGKTLAELTLPESEYGTYSWADETTTLDTIGENTYAVVFTPNDVLRFKGRNDFKAKVEVYRSVKDDGLTTKITGKTGWVYNGHPHKPEVAAYMDGELLSKEDYEVRYSENIDAGWGYYWIDGKNYYKDSKGYSFSISKADLTITAKDVFLKNGDEMPQPWEYEVDGLADGDTLVKEPVITVTATDTLQNGIFEIIPSAAEATDNYNESITYVNGKLQIAEEKVGYTVTFDVQGHGNAPAAYIGIKAGDVIACPQEPEEEGYVFAGWYKDASCTKVWNFETDTVQEDITLYAKWNVVKQDISFCVSEISDVTYTGKALKPTVKVYDGETLLKQKKDYTITYHNSTNVNVVKAGSEFNPELPYVTIVGKGNYTDTIQINFNVLPAVIGDENGTQALGVNLKYNDQLVVNYNKDVIPFKSMSLGRTLNKGVDFDIALEPMDAVDANGEPLTDTISNGAVPAGSRGTFMLVINAKGNYTGCITKVISVTYKPNLLKNASITLGKNLKNIDFDTYQNLMKGKLTPAYYDKATKKYYAVTNGTVDYNSVLNAKDVFVVKYGNTSLIYQKDFTISYLNNKQTGTATMVIQGMGEYLGSKSATFTLKGKTFSAKTINVETIAPQTYTGRPITVNDVKLSYKDGSEDGLPLEYGKHYTISYANHINKGKATITFKAKGDSGYQGSFKKTFVIGAAPIASVIPDASMQDISVEYDKAGAKPADRVILRNAAGLVLKEGKDYKLTYEYNKAIADKNATNAPTIVITGKGNYGGESLRIPFTITPASLDSSKITISVKEMAYNSKKADTYAYKPEVTVKDGKKNLRKDVDYTVEYKFNTQADYEAYYLSEEGLSEEFMPRIEIKAGDGSAYVLNETMELPLPVYVTKLKKANLHVVVAETKYTGTQVKPQVAVYYSEDASKVKAVKNLTDEEAILAQGLVKLTKDTDYVVSYGKNIAAGKNKGTVTISGISPSYGGSVTVKFSIGSKNIIW